MPKNNKVSPRKKTPAAAKKPAGKAGVVKAAKPDVAATPPVGSYAHRLRNTLRHPLLEKIFLWFSLTALTITIVFWTVLSANLHESNADQFIDAYLFESVDTFRSALFPGAHTFLLKWPLFAIMQLYGHHTFVFLAATLLMVLATVGALIYLLHKIESRPYIFGTLCLLLASVLLLVPAQPHAGALLPTNFAMTTTRNLEYIVFILCIYGMTYLKTMKSALFWLLTGLLAIVIASDKLFAVLAVGSALIVLVGYVGIMRRRYEVNMAVLWLLLGAVAFGLANLLLIVISELRITHIVDEEMTSPFMLVQTFGQLAQGLLYGVLALLTNFGANPVHDILIIRDIPSTLLNRILQPSIVVYVFNLAVFVFALYASIKIVASRSTDRATRLTLVLLAATMTAFAVFVLTDHYYPVDARYITISLFALFIGLAAYLRGKQVRLRYVGIVAALSSIVLPLGMVQAWHEFRVSQSALSSQNKLTVAVANILDRKNIERIVGDYWEVTPVKSRTADNVTISPVDNCSQPRPALNSLAWFDNPKSQPTAFLAIRDAGSSTYKGCSLARLATLYGTPTERVTLAENAEPPYSPNALLLVYENGVSPLEERPQPQASIALPHAPTVTALREKSNCPETSLNVIAHQDDDLLFMNPDVLQDIRGGRCVRTVYITAGDAGVTSSYWQSRELGAKAAYATMFDVPNVWRDNREMLAGRFVTVSYLEAAPRVALVFLRLPDGNMRGEGFAGSDYHSLQQLMDGMVPSLFTVDDETEYSKDQLVQSVLGLMNTDTPAVIRTQGSLDAADGDHSDHHAVGTITQLAREQYQTTASFSTYSGYPTKQQPVNLSDDEITIKQLPFFAYAKHDGAVCQTAFECQQTVTYGSYLTRQYKLTY